MTGILQKFSVEQSLQGARIIARSEHLTGSCMSDHEIDKAVQALKDDLDACAREMKRRLAIEHRGSMFEGWASDLE